jgi:hypothetical protein
LEGQARGVSLEEIDAPLQRSHTQRLLGAEQPPYGTATADVRASARGATIEQLLDSLSGRAQVSIRDGSVAGADAVATLQRLADGEFHIADGRAPFIPVAGRTRFDRFDARLTVDAGAASAEVVRMVGDRFEITLTGALDLADGVLQGEGSASLFPSAGRVRPRMHELPFGIGGTLQQPMAAPGIPRMAEDLHATGQPAALVRRPRGGRVDPDVG